MDPTQWTAFERLCQMNVALLPQVVFNENHPLIQKINNSVNSQYESYLLSGGGVSG